MTEQIKLLPSFIHFFCYSSSFSSSPRVAIPPALTSVQHFVHSKLLSPWYYTIHDFQSPLISFVWKAVRRYAHPFTVCSPLKSDRFPNSAFFSNNKLRGLNILQIGVAVFFSSKNWIGQVWLYTNLFFFYLSVVKRKCTICSIWKGRIYFYWYTIELWHDDVIELCVAPVRWVCSELFNTEIKIKPM